MIQSVYDIAKLLVNKDFDIDGELFRNRYGNVHISRQGDLALFNYSNQAAIDNKWNRFECLSRGLIINAVTGEIVAHPMEKFFNLGQKFDRKPTGHMAEVTEKIDGCFHHTTPILLPDGTYNHIGSIVNNPNINKVMGYNHETGEVEPVKIINKFNNGTKNNWIIVYTDHQWSNKGGSRYSDSPLRVTSNHKFFDGVEYKPISEFRIGDTLYCYDRPVKYRTGQRSILATRAFGTEKYLREAKITKIVTDPLTNDSQLQNSRCAYDLETETHNFFSKGILVHNSCGILYRENGEHKISTRGSFDGPQAQWATKFLRDNYDLTGLPSCWTLVFEIIFSENRIVVNYGDREDLVLIAAINRDTGEDVSFYDDGDCIYKLAEHYGFNTPATYQFNSVEAVMEASDELSHNEEGYVLRFSCGTRLKIKGDRYLTAHRILSNATWKNIVKAVEDGSIDDILYMLPDEFTTEIRAWVKYIYQSIKDSKRHINVLYRAAPKDTRKEYAVWVMRECRLLAPLMFARLDEKPLSSLLYKRLIEHEPDNKQMERYKSITLD